VQRRVVVLWLIKQSKTARQELRSSVKMDKSMQSAGQHLDKVMWQIQRGQVVETVRRHVSG